MFRKLTLRCPVNLDQLDRIAPEQRTTLLRFLSYDGVKRISIVGRGGDRRPLSPEPDEAMYVEASDNARWPAESEERFGDLVSGYQEMHR